jgi:hypothetical protein
MYMQYDVWVVIDPDNKDWVKIEADSLQNAAEAGVLAYDSRPDVDYALSKEGTVVQVLVRDPLQAGMAHSFDVSCTLNPFYELTGSSAQVAI